MSDDNHDGENHHDEPPQATASEIPEDRIADILNRLTTLELSMQQIRIAVESLAGSVGSMPSTMIAVISAINTLCNSMSHLTSASNMHGVAVNTVAASTGSLLNHAAMIHADTQALRMFQAPSCADQSRSAPASAPFAYAMISDAPGETGRF